MLPSLPSIAEAQALMRQGKLRPIDLVEHCLGRIHQFEDQIHAWVTVDEEGARKEAFRLGKMLDDGQEPVGPLHGIPIGIKDIIDVAGWPTLCGSKLREGHVAEDDATVVEGLREAGAIILGKTVTTEWASFDPPPTRNPWNLNHTPGGSSSGSAAAVAMEMCMAALGTQTGGSIVRPASYCGVVGLKPDFGRPFLRGIFPFSRSLDHVGPIGRSVADLKLIHKVLGGYQSHLPPDDVTELCFLEGGFLEAADSTTKHAMAHVQEKLSAHFPVKPFRLPKYFRDIHALHRCVMAVEAADIHREAYETKPGDYPLHIRGLIEEGLNTTAYVYARALRRQQELRSKFFMTWGYDKQKSIFVLPSTATAAPGIETTGNPLFNSPWSYLGVPAITIPMATCDGLPLGLQFTTIMLSLMPSFFDAIENCERVIGFNERPALLSRN